MMQNIGKVKIEGKTLTQYLQKTFDSKDYQNRQEGDINNDGGKEMYIKKIYKGFKDMAYYKMLEEYPDVKKAIIKAIEQRYSLLGTIK
jgi:hypothetical protein